MTGRRPLFQAVFLLLLPLLVAAFDLSLASAGLLVIVALLWRWAVTLSGLLSPVRLPELQLDTIAASHFAEKVRWCMDRTGLEYSERQAGGTLGVFFLGRTVPQLKVVTGAVRSTIGNSSDILRFIWGRYGGVSDEPLEFLRPTPERLALEQAVDRYGVDLQVWAYYHVISEREQTLHVWGRDCSSLPRWQRVALVVLYPLLKRLMILAFGISADRYQSACARIERFLGELELKLGDGRRGLLGAELSYADLSAAAMSGPWLMVPEFGGGKSDAVAPDQSLLPVPMQGDIERWRRNYPLFVAFTEGLYKTERGRALG